MQVTCCGATPSLALRINSLMLMTAPCLTPEALVGVTWGVPYGVPAGVSSDLADKEVELGITLGFTLGCLSSSELLAAAHLLGLKHPCGPVSLSCRLVGLFNGDAADGIGALIIFDK